MNREPRLDRDRDGGPQERGLLRHQRKARREPIHDAVAHPGEPRVELIAARAQRLDRVGELVALGDGEHRADMHCLDAQRELVGHDALRALAIADLTSASFSIFLRRSSARLPPPASASALTARKRIVESA
jgi:hypothetical protein